MLGKVFFEAMRKVISNVQQKNHDDPNIKTANSKVFEEINRKVEETESKEQEIADSPMDIFEMMREKMRQARVENERNPEVETADSSVFDNVLQEIERLKDGVKSEGGSRLEIPDIPNPMDTSPSERAEKPVGVMMTTNSGGGSLALRANPDMSAAENTIRIPHQSSVRVINQSNKSIRLDGQVAHWIEVEYDDQVGWILDTYLK